MAWLRRAAVTVVTIARSATALPATRPPACGPLHAADARLAGDAERLAAGARVRHDDRRGRGAERGVEPGGVAEVDRQPGEHEQLRHAVEGRLEERARLRRAALRARDPAVHEVEAGREQVEPPAHGEPAGGEQRGGDAGEERARDGDGVRGDAEADAGA